MPNIVIISTTLGNAEAAKSMAAQIVDAKLAACVQIDGPIQSVYRWKGELCFDEEYRLLCKTLPALSQQAVEFLRQHHSYELPELVVNEVESSQDYYQWLSEQVKDCQTL